MVNNKRNFLVLAVVIVLLVVGIVMTNNKGGSAGALDSDSAKTAANDFINQVLMNGAGGASVESVSEYQPKLYALKVKLEGSEELIDSYISADGQLFFPQSLNIAEMSGTATAAAPGDGGSTTVTPVAQAVKSDRPQVELFVMSHCPYGTQMEKGIMPVAAALANDIDFEIKFVNYAMHGKVELDEQMLQYCLQAEQGDQFAPYLNCFLQDGNTERCLGQVQVDRTALNACISATDTKYRISEVYNSNEGWSNYPPFPIHDTENQDYGVQGSPTLVINGEQVRANRDSASLAAVICGAFNSPPEACSQSFSTAAPAPGFGTGTTASSAAAACAS